MTNYEEYSMYEQATDFPSNDMWMKLERPLLMIMGKHFSPELQEVVKEVVKWPVDRSIHRFEEILSNDLSPPRHIGRRFA